MKWVLYLLLAVAVAYGWMWRAKPDPKIAKWQSQIEHAENTGEDTEKIQDWKGDIEAKKNESIITGILLAFLSAGLAGVVGVVEILPAFANRLTHSVYDSAEMVEKDVMHDARSKVAQGDYAGAIDSFKEAAAADPMNRLPWVEIAKIQKENLEDPGAAIGTIRHALESQEWEINDAAYFLFRLAELYDQDAGDRGSAVSILQQVMEQFPNTRHAANARFKLNEWGLI